jgi:hypothetical protein
VDNFSHATTRTLVVVFFFRDASKFQRGGKYHPRIIIRLRTRVLSKHDFTLNCAETVEKKISKILHFESSALKEQSIMRPSAARTSSSPNIVPLLTDDDSDDENKRLDRELHKDLVNSLRDTVSACFYRGEFQLYSLT